MRVTLLGPQHSPSLRSVVRSLDVDGPVATVTAGWQERERDDSELDQQVDSRGVNLCLYGRWLDVSARDPEFAAAERGRRRVLAEVQELYLLRLDHAIGAAYALARRGGEQRLRDDALAEAITAVRDLDAGHLARIATLDDDFYGTWRPQDRPVVAGHRAEVARVLGGAAALVVAGPGRRPGRRARARMLLDDTVRMAVFARRFAPSRCLPLENGTRVDTDGAGTCPPGTRVLGTDGRIAPTATKGAAA